MEPSHTQVAIVGGGIAGLALGFHLQRAGVDAQVFEARERTGGNIRSEARKGYLCEWGPNGWLDNDSRELKDLFETSSIFVFPSHAENFPLVLLEAMAAGMAIAADMLRELTTIPGVSGAHVYAPTDLTTIPQVLELAGLAD